MSEPEVRAPFKRDPETLHRQTTNHVFPFPSHTHTLPLFSLLFLLSYSLYYSPSWNQPNVPSSVAGHCCPSARRPLYVQAPPPPPGWCFWCWVPALRLHSATTRGTPYRRAYSFIWLWGSPGTVKTTPVLPSLSLFSRQVGRLHPIPGGQRPPPPKTNQPHHHRDTNARRPSPIAHPRHRHRPLCGSLLLAALSPDCFHRRRPQLRPLPRDLHRVPASWDRRPSRPRRSAVQRQRQRSAWWHVLVANPANFLASSPPSPIPITPWP